MKLRHYWKKGLLSALTVAALMYPDIAGAERKNVMCIKTDTGHYIPVIRVSMMVVPDASSTFEILLKDGEGETNVGSISFEEHEEDIDESALQPSSPSDDKTDYSKMLYLLTSTGKYFALDTSQGEVPVLKPVEGTDKFDISFAGTEEKNVSYIYFHRSDTPQEIENIVGISPHMEDWGGSLQLLTPVRSSMLISGCGNAAKAIVYSTNGTIVGEAEVTSGTANVSVAGLPSGVYMVKVGNKSLKFTKQQ